MNDMPTLADRFGRTVDYVRLSVTDRCDFRCVYCMAEEMTFLPRDQILSLEEMIVVATTFRRLGVKKMRITGGEPLIRRDVIHLFQQLGKLNFDDLSLTTNGSHLQKYARSLVDAGVHRVNISLDTLDPLRFKKMTRTGQLEQVLGGVDAALAAGFSRIKLNCVVLKNHNADEIHRLTQFALDNNLDISFIEEMPLGVISEHSRHLEFVSSASIRESLAEKFNLTATEIHSSGPSKYWTIPGKKSRIGFISPHSENFCATCNRVRVSAEGRLLLCLGNEHSVDLRRVLRSQPTDGLADRLAATIVDAMAIKPEKHHFDLHEPPQILRFMNATGG